MLDSRKKMRSLYSNSSRVFPISGFYVFFDCYCKGYLLSLIPKLCGFFWEILEPFAMFQVLSVAVPLLQWCLSKQDKTGLGFGLLGSLCLNTQHGRRDGRGKHQRLACLLISVSCMSSMEISEIKASCKSRISAVSLNLVQISGFRLLYHWAFQHLATCHCCSSLVILLPLLGGFLWTLWNWNQDLWTNLLVYDRVQDSHKLKPGCRRLEGKSSE